MIFNAQLGDATLGAFTLGEINASRQIDSINYWSDSVIVFASLTGVAVADDLNNWSDEFLSSSLYTSILGGMTLGYISLGQVNNEVGGASLGPTPAYSVTSSDTLSLSDTLTLHQGLIFSDSLNNLVDSVTQAYLIFTVNQTINVGSSLATRPGPGSSPPRDAWKDGLVYETNPFSGLYLSVDDLEAFLSAYAQLGVGLIFSDSLNNWSDTLVSSGTPGVFAFDTLFYNIADEIGLGFGTFKTQSDSLNNLSDAVSLRLFSTVVEEDSLNLADAVQITFVTLPHPGDILSLVDARTLVLGYRLTFSDNVNNFVDLFINSPASGPFSESFTDALSMNDATSTLLNASLSNYLRRYLNDVVN